ncbi:hypothetical protein MY8738_008569 [Beauveria namnaoensis]
MACWNSCLAATFAAIAWCLLDIRLTGKWSMVSWCSGTISGLVAATPASGFIDPWASIILGVVAGVCCNFGTKSKFKVLVHIDDSLDVFAEHGIGGMVGLIFNAFFATKKVIGLDGVKSGTLGGFLDRKYATISWQIAAIVSATAYAFIISAIVAKIIDFVPGLKLRASEEAELVGMDDDQHGGFSYDYVEVRRDFLAWRPQTGRLTGEGVITDPQHGIQENAKIQLDTGQREKGAWSPVTRMLTESADEFLAIANVKRKGLFETRWSETVIVTTAGRPLMGLDDCVGFTAL